MQLKREMDPNKKDRILRIVSEIGQYSIASITYNPSDIVVFHHDDIDGKLAGQLIYETFSIPNTDRFVCCNYSSTMPDISFIKDTDLVFIVDYCIPLEQLKPIIKSANFVIWLDHHKTSVDMVNNNFDYFADQVKLGNIIMDIDMNRCGAKIVSNKLYKIGTQWNEEVVEAVDKYDRWTKEDIRGDYINQFMYNSAMPYVGSEAWNKILHDDEYFKWACEIGKKFYDFNLTKNELIYESFAKEVEFHGMKMSVIEGYGNSQLFGDHINEYDACCVFHITKNKKWQYSLYCANPNTDLSTIAELYGGGGHKNASGFHLDKKLF